VLPSRGSGHYCLGPHSTSFQRRGRFMVSTETPEVPASAWGPTEHTCLHLSMHADRSGTSLHDTGLHAGVGLGVPGPVAAAAGHVVHAYGHSGSVGSSLNLLPGHDAAQAAGPPHWGGSVGAGLQSGWPALGVSVSAPQAHMDLMPTQQQQQGQGLVMQLSAPARLGAGVAQPGTSSTPTALSAAAAGGRASDPSVQGFQLSGTTSSRGPEGPVEALPGSVADPSCRQLAGKGYWGSGIIRQPSAALQDSSSYVSHASSLRCSHEGFDRCQAVPVWGSVPPGHALLAAVSPGGYTSPQGGSNDGGQGGSDGLAAAAQQEQEQQQQSGSSGAGGMCYRSGRFHVTVEQLQAWQQRQQQLQDQHAHLPHKSNSTGALLAAAGMAVAAQPPSAADIHGGSPAPQQQQQQQDESGQQAQQPKLLHASSSCSSLLAAQQVLLQQQSQQQTGSPSASIPALQAKQQRSKEPSDGGLLISAAGAAQGAASRAGPRPAEEAGTDTKRLCDVQPDSSTGPRSADHPAPTTQQQQQQHISSPSCLKLKAAPAAKPTTAGSLAHPAPHGPRKPPVVPCKTPSPGATPCLSPKLQRAKSRDYCTGRFQVHESPVASHIRQDWRGPAGSGPSHSICVAELQQLQQHVQAQQQQQRQQPPPQQHRASSPSAGGAGPVATAAAAGGSGQQAVNEAAGMAGGAGLVQPQQSNAAAAAAGSSGASPLAQKARSRSSAGLSDTASTMMPAAAAVTSKSSNAVSSVDSSHAAADELVGNEGGSSGGAQAAAAAAAAAAVVQQRGRFTVRQESRSGSQAGSAHGSKHSSPCPTPRHGSCDRLSKLGSK
jgi:hypothetical protein